MKRRLVSCMISSATVGACVAGFAWLHTPARFVFIPIGLAVLGVVISSAQILMQGDSYDNNAGGNGTPTPPRVSGAPQVRGRDLNDPVQLVHTISVFLLAASVSLVAGGYILQMTLINGWVALTGVFMAVAGLSMSFIRSRELAKSGPVSGWKS
jgi:hypothetical protein